MSSRPRLPGYFPVVPVLMGLSGVAWLVTNGVAGPDMRLGVLTDSGGMADMGSMSGGVAGLSLFMATWLVMMVAMMFPAVSPVVLTFRLWAQRSEASRWKTPIFVAGYLAVWSAAGIIVYLILLVLQEHVPPGDPTSIRVGALLLAGAGLYQLTPLKAACLKHCRSPMGQLMRYGPILARGYRGPFEVGVRHGSYCLGCCWSLMLVLILVGVMNLAWMALVAAVVFVEKVLPRGAIFGRAFGILLMVAAVVLVSNPSTLPALS